MKNISAIILLIGIFIIAVYFLIVPAAKLIPSPYIALNYSDLAGWQDDDHDIALEAFQASCKKTFKLSG